MSSRFGNHPVNLMSVPQHCSKHLLEYYSITCPECMKEDKMTSPYIMEQNKLSSVRKSIESYFHLPGIGNLTLDFIVSQCLSHPEVKSFLSNYDEGSIEFYMQRHKIVHIIQGQIEAYIDNKLEPQ